MTTVSNRLLFASFFLNYQHVVVYMKQDRKNGCQCEPIKEENERKNNISEWQ